MVRGRLKFLPPLIVLLLSAFITRHLPTPFRPEDLLKFGDDFRHGRRPNEVAFVSIPQGRDGTNRSLFAGRQSDGRPLRPGLLRGAIIWTHSVFPW